MPFSYLPITRRQFVRQAAGSTAALLTISCTRTTTAPPPAEEHLAILSDTHIPADPAVASRGVNMTDQLQQVVSEVAAMQPRHAAAIINGDCAYNDGRSGDYQSLLATLEPLTQAGLPIHMTLGNHDHRDHFLDIVKPGRPRRGVVGKHVLKLELHHARFLLLDSLDVVNAVPGALGDGQLTWLGMALDEDDTRPTIVFVHHNLEFDVPEGKNYNGLTDSQALVDVLKARPNVKALVHGHTHHWQQRMVGDLNVISLPPTSYVFVEGRPSGWVDATVTATGMTMQLKSIDPAHAEHNQTFALNWTGV